MKITPKTFFALAMLLASLKLFSQSPQPGDIVISEIMYKNYGQGYVELYNTTNTSFTFDANIVAGTSSNYVLNLGTITIPGKSFFVASRGLSIQTDATATSNNFMERGLDYESFVLNDDSSSPWIQLSKAESFGMTGTTSNQGKSLELINVKSYSGSQPGEFTGTDYQFSTLAWAEGDGSPYSLGSTTDPLTTISINPTSLQVSESAFTTSLTLQILDPDLNNDMTVDLSLTSGDSSQIGNFESTILQIPAGSTSFTYDLHFFDNNFVNEDRNFIFEISNPTGGYGTSITQDKFYLTITDDDLNYVGFNDGWLSPNGTQQGIYIDTVTTKVGIGTSIMPGQYLLFVKQGIRAERLRVDVADDNGWADYVFEKGYDLMSLSDLKAFVKREKHLPEIPTTKDVNQDGIDVAEMNALLLKKIEELTLYLIQQDSEIKDLKKQVQKLKK
ncbi:MAG: lamin tail domain-containing protein [bacterium]|nr:lamin tail domain-containing protein [bacterium]